MRLVPSLLLAPLFLFSAPPAPAEAGPLRDWFTQRRVNAAGGDEERELVEAGRGERAVAPAGVTVERDVEYGLDAAQRFDVYLPGAGTRDAPVILMVHGGGWAHGDKAMQAVVANKVAHWVPKGFIVVSTNYRLVPAADPLRQARDLARALATVQAKAPRWGGDPNKLILMGHSAGAHLAALLTASPEIAPSHGARPWLGTVALDSAAYDVEALMEGRHAGLYDQAFGPDPSLWKAASPVAQLRGATPPLLAVCSTRRTDSCRSAQQFVRRASALGTHAQALGQDLSHKGINEELGRPGSYTEAVDAFLAGLDPAVAQRLRR